MTFVNFGPVGGSPAPDTGNERDADTHGQMVQATGGTAAGDTALGTITFPANGPWEIFGVYGLIASPTATPAESIGGSISLNALNGDIEPNPAPSKFPLPNQGAFLNTTHAVQHCPLNIVPVSYMAPGKSQVSMVYNNPNGSTVAPIVIAGLIYGKNRPQPRILIYSDRVRAQVKATTETSVGTITMSENATHITGLCFMLSQDNVITTAEELVGTFRLDSDDIKMTPAVYPPSAVFGAGIGATIANGLSQMPLIIPVNIPVKGGARINCFVNLITALTNEAECSAFVMYE